jgi:hypothetical protein
LFADEEQGMPDGTLVLTDRETGRDDDEYETEPRMKVYVLWAMQYYQMRPDDISTELVFLKTGGTKQFALFRGSYTSWKS